jgi:hypothetical protein
MPHPFIDGDDDVDVMDDVEQAMTEQLDTAADLLVPPSAPPVPAHPGVDSRLAAGCTFRQAAGCVGRVDVRVRVLSLRTFTYGKNGPVNSALRGECVDADGHFVVWSDQVALFAAYFKVDSCYLVPLKSGIASVVRTASTRSTSSSRRSWSSRGCTARPRAYSRQ